MTAVQHKTRAYMCDLDGTIALFRHHRGPYEFDKCGNDLPNTPVIKVVRKLTLGSRSPVKLICVSGREETCRPQTMTWLRQQGLTRLTSRPVAGYETLLLMRPAKDNRADQVVKEEIYRTDIEPRYDVLGVFDDRDRVVKMWRELGLTCFQVAEGDF